MAKTIALPVMKQKRWVPWLYLLPAMIIMSIFILIQ